MTLANLLANTPQETYFGLGFAVLFVAGLLAVVGLVVAAVFSILFARIDGGMKVVWLVFVVIAPVIGALLWFLVGRSRTPVRHW